MQKYTLYIYMLYVIYYVYYTSYMLMSVYWLDIWYQIVWVGWMQAEGLYLQTPGLPGRVMEEDADKNRSNKFTIIALSSLQEQDSIVIFITFILVILVIFILVILVMFRVRQEMSTLVEPAMREASIRELCSLTGAWWWSLTKEWFFPQKAENTLSL